MESVPEYEKQRSLRAQEAFKRKTVGFFRGCDFKRCLHTDCPNFIGGVSFDEMRADAERSVATVAELIEDGSIDVECAVPIEPISALPEMFHGLNEFFSFDFNTVLNMTSELRLDYFNRLQAEIESKLLSQDTQFRLNSLLYFDAHYKKRIYAVAKIIESGVLDYDLFETVLVFFFSFSLIFDFELFNERFKVQEVFAVASFKKMFSDNWIDRFLKSPVHQIVTKKRIGQLNEELQNLFTLCFPGTDFLTATGQARKFSITVICQSIQFLVSLNALQPAAKRLPLAEFANATLSEDCSDKHATLLFIANHPGHPLTALLNDVILKEVVLDEVNYMQFPFLFTVDRRVDVLRQESYLSQHLETFGGNGHSLMSMLLSGSLYLSLNLRRNNLMEDALKQLSNAHNQNNLRKKLKISFVGEPGVDEGGVKKEFFNLLSDQLFDPNFGMFVVKNERFLWFNSSSFEGGLNFELIGTLLGLALYNEVILNLKFPLAVYKKIIAAGSQRPIHSDLLSLEDLKEFEPQLHQTLSNLLEKDWTDRDTGLTFSVTSEVFGEIKETELIPNGSSTEVTESNKKDFVDRYLAWYFDKSIQTQFKPFAIGFFRVLLKDSFTLFNAEDLQLALCGTEVLDFHNLKKTTNYENYTENSETIVHFWNVLLNDFDDNQRREFLKFLTGSDRSPIRGLADIKMIVTKTGDSNSLPSAHTCFNHLILPDYKSYEKLKSKLLKAIENSEGFGLF